MTVENVAQRAGVHKTTVYRRWKDRERLLIDALAEHMATDIPVPDTGAIETDLRALARSIVQAFTSPAGQAILAAMFTGPPTFRRSPQPAGRCSTTGSPELSRC